MSDRKFVRENAKKEYKRLMKGVPKHRRLPFSAVYKLVAASSKASDGLAMPMANVAPEVDMDELNDMLGEATDETGSPE